MGMGFGKQVVFSAQRILLFLCVWKDHRFMRRLRWQLHAEQAAALSNKNT